jgi:hypothetical protein
MAKADLASLVKSLEKVKPKAPGKTAGPRAPAPSGFPAYTELVARTANYLVFSDGEKTLIAGLKEWPPQTRVLKIAATTADEAPDGSLVLLTGQELKAMKAVRVESPLGAATIKPVPAYSDASCSGFSKVAFIGGRPLFIARPRKIDEDGSSPWKPVFLEGTSFKPAPGLGTHPPADPNLLCFMKVSEETLVWAGAAYVWKGNRFEKTVDKLRGLASKSAVPAPKGGLYYLGGCAQLLEQAPRGKPVLHATDDVAHWAKEVAVGPAGTLLLRLCENGDDRVGSIYFPSQKKFVTLDQGLFPVGEDSETLFYAPATDRILCVGRGKLIGHPAQDLLRRKPKRVNGPAWKAFVARYER